jgi:hypothetical protein
MLEWEQIDSKWVATGSRNFQPHEILLRKNLPGSDQWVATFNGRDRIFVANDLQTAKQRATVFAIETMEWKLLKDTEMLMELREDLTTRYLTN